jgi:hypothetical protein
MLILPLKTSSRNSIKDDLSKWLDNQWHNQTGSGSVTSMYGHNHHNSSSATSTTTTTLPPPSFDTVLQKQQPTLTSAQCYMELQRLQSVRNCIVDSILKANSHPMAIKENALRDCYEYHAILLQFEQHGFSDSATMAPSSEQQPFPAITWKGAYDNSESETHSTLVWDRVCIMYNIAALLSYQIYHNYSMPKLSSVTDRDVFKAAIRDSQLCASILSILRELCTTISKSDTPFFTIDLSPQLLSFWEKLFIAEAQHYIYRMASMTSTTTTTEDNDAIGRKHRTDAVLCQSMHELYNDALTATKDPRLVSEIYDHVQSYGYYTKTSSMLSLGRAYYHQSIVYHANGEYGNEIAALRDCQIKLQQGIDFINQESSNGKNSGSKDKKKGKDATTSTTFINTIDTSYLLRECQTLLAIVKDTIRTVDDMNLRIYHNVIPKAIPQIPSQQLAKINPILPNDMIIPQIPLFLDD